MAIATLGAFALPASASAKPWNCEASVLDLGVGPQPAQSPITANAGQSECKNATAGGTGPSLAPLPVSGNLLSARTTITPRDRRARGAEGHGHRRDRQPVRRPDGEHPGHPRAAGAAGAVDHDPGRRHARHHGRAAGTRQRRRTSSCSACKLASATASAQCSGGKPVYTGSAKVASLTVLGQELPTDAVVSQAINVVGGGSVDPVAGRHHQDPAASPLTLEPDAHVARSRARSTSCPTCRSRRRSRSSTSPRARRPTSTASSRSAARACSWRSAASRCST